MIRQASVQCLNRNQWEFKLPLGRHKDSIHFFKSCCRQGIRPRKLSPGELNFSQIKTINYCVKKERPAVIESVVVLFLTVAHHIEVPPSKVGKKLCWHVLTNSIKNAGLKSS